MGADYPILYSFRRCPYAMRARLALTVSGESVQLREVVLRDKPAHMLEVSPKGTVPVLLLSDGSVYEESLDVMLWALNIADPEKWLHPEIDGPDSMHELIHKCDTDFKYHLDRYKYHTRYNDADPKYHRIEAEKFLQALEKRLESHAFLFGKRFSLADAAIAPFIRQFVNASQDWFPESEYDNIKLWLVKFLDSKIFKNIMQKFPQWQEGDQITFFPTS
jgi:glutathione S-transferase